MKGYKELVKNFLQMHPETRDNDELLYMMIATELKIDNLPTYRLLKTLRFNSVVRWRAELQEYNTDLRGNKYYDRKKHGDKVREHYRQLKHSEQLFIS